MLALRSSGINEDGSKRGTTTVRVLKNRYSGETGVACELIYDLDTCKFNETESTKSSTQQQISKPNPPRGDGQESTVRRQDVPLERSMNLIFDIETNGLYYNVTTIHCLAIHDLETKTTFLQRHGQSRTDFDAAQKLRR